MLEEIGSCKTVCVCGGGGGETVFVGIGVKTYLVLFSSSFTFLRKSKLYFLHLVMFTIC